MRIVLEDLNLANAERAIITEGLRNFATLEDVAEACGVTLPQLERKMRLLGITRAKASRTKDGSRSKRKEGKK